MNQLPLFGAERAETEQRPPDLAYIRRSLNRLLRLAREAQIMPWSQGETESWEKLFPELASALPVEEAEPLTSAFRSELARLRSAEVNGAKGNEDRPPSGSIRTAEAFTRR
jgi:hypothetical protein